MDLNENSEDIHNGVKIEEIKISMIQRERKREHIQYERERQKAKISSHKR